MQQCPCSSSWSLINCSVPLAAEYVVAEEYRADGSSDKGYYAEDWTMGHHSHEDKNILSLAECSREGSLSLPTQQGAS